MGLKQVFLVTVELCLDTGGPGFVVGKFFSDQLLV